MFPSLTVADACSPHNTPVIYAQEHLKEMRDELNDALNEIALLTRIRNEEKRLSSERYMQLCSAQAQLDAGEHTL